MHLGRLGALLDLSGARLGRVTACLGRLGARLGRLGALLGRLGALLSRLGALLGRLGALRLGACKRGGGVAIGDDARRRIARRLLLDGSSQALELLAKFLKLDLPLRRF